LIVFKSIKWKNFLAVGNSFIEIDFLKYRNVLLVGANGSGKSTLLDALTFVLFGKAFRKINKPLLVNSINEKDCVVEIEFSNNGKNFKVIRGIKPNIFQIYCDGVFINQDSESKDYQSYLEKNILRMSFKTFTQIVILGSASFTPFMQLSSGDRRNIIEDLLDIKIFSVMNIIAKQKLQLNIEQIERKRTLLIGKEEKLSYIKKMITDLKSNNEEKVASLKERGQEISKEIGDISVDIQSIDAKINNSLDNSLQLNKIKAKRDKLIELRSKIDMNFKRGEKDIFFYENNDSCPTCKQDIDDGFKRLSIETIGEKTKEYKKGLGDITEELNSCLKQMTTLNDSILQNQNLQSKKTALQEQVNRLLIMKKDLDREIDKTENSDNILIENTKEFELVSEEISNLKNERGVLLLAKKYDELAINLLKDGGIKTKIIKQYLPMINKIINKYLNLMDFFINFEIDENFDEVIRSRYREEFSYSNFSEGEKSRINLAILFAWREVAKLKNSANTNLLIFDETCDSSLDIDGVEELLKIIHSVNEDTSIFLISHKEILLDKFKHSLTFKKHKNFSILGES
jgi:DNA repair exonuclease SbcCD ATPase subunit